MHVLTRLQGRSLEEVDALFDAHIWAWQFKGYKTTGTAGLLTDIENHGVAAAAAEDDDAGKTPVVNESVARGGA